MYTIQVSVPRGCLETSGVLTVTNIIHVLFMKWLCSGFYIA